MTVMTGSAAGPLGGNSGAAFGSGLTSFTLSPGEKVFNEFLTPWLKKSEEDKQIQELHRQEFTELSGKKLAEAKAKDKFRRKSREAADAAFRLRQQRLAEEEARERSRVAKARKEALAKPTLGDPQLGTAANRKRLEDMSVLREEDVARWLWPTQKQLLEVGKTRSALDAKGLGAEHEDAMTTLPQNASEATVQAYVKNIVGNSKELTRQAVATRLHRDQELADKAAREKAEREAQEEMRKQEILRKQAEAKKARVQLERKIKKEMEAETRKAANEEEERARKRYEKSMEEWKENKRRLHQSETDILRTDMQIANERREGTSMSKGGKAEFLDAMRDKTKNHDDLEQFM